MSLNCRDWERTDTPHGSKLYYLELRLGKEFLHTLAQEIGEEAFHERVRSIKIVDIMQNLEHYSLIRRLYIASTKEISLLLQEIGGIDMSDRNK